MQGIEEIMMVKKRLMRVERSEEDSRKPYALRIHWFDGKASLCQPVSEEEFFRVINELLADNTLTLDVEIKS